MRQNMRCAIIRVIFLLVLNFILSAALASQALVGITRETNRDVTLLSPETKFIISGRTGELLSGEYLSSSLKVFTASSDSIEICNENIDFTKFDLASDDVKNVDIREGKVIFEC